MSTDSDSAKTAKTLGIVTSVLTILAFFGIANWDDLRRLLDDHNENSTGSASSSPSPPGSLDNAAMGDCVTLDSEGIFGVVPCDDPRARARVHARVPFQDCAYEKFQAAQGDSSGTCDVPDHWNESATCAIALQWPVFHGPANHHMTGVVSIYSSGTREVVCIIDR